MRFISRRLTVPLVALATFALSYDAHAKLAVIKRPVQNTLDVANHLIITIRDDQTWAVISRDLLNAGNGMTAEGPNEVDRLAIEAFWSAYAAGQPTPDGYAIVPKPPAAVDDATWERAVVTMFDNVYECDYQNKYPMLGQGLNSNSIVDETLREAGLDFHAIVDLPQFSATPYQKAWRDVRSPNLRFAGCSLSIGGHDLPATVSSVLTPTLVEAPPGSYIEDPLIWTPGSSPAGALGAGQTEQWWVFDNTETVTGYQIATQGGLNPGTWQPKDEDTKLWVYRGDPGQLTLVGMNDNCGNALSACVPIAFTPGRYYFKVTAAHGQAIGLYALIAEEAP